MPFCQGANAQQCRASRDGAQRLQHELACSLLQSSHGARQTQASSVRREISFRVKEKVPGQGVGPETESLFH